jgi:hypothetical protein
MEPVFIPVEGQLPKLLKRWGLVLWIAAIVAFAAAHLLHLRADFPNQSPWYSDWAKYTDEGWYGNAAIRAHLFGHWYMPGDFNPAPAVPVWPFLEWVLFGMTGVSVVAARALSVSFFFADLGLAYLLLRTRVQLRARRPRWTAMLAVTLMVTSPFLYSFSRLAILEPMLMAFLLTALNLAVRLPQWRRPVLVSVGIGLLYTMMLLTKTSAAFLLPALAWALAVPLRKEELLRWRCAAAAAAASAVSFAGWMALVVGAGMLKDYRYLFFINKYNKPHEWYWPALSFWWSLHGVMWADRILLPLVGILVVAAVLAWRTEWSRGLRGDPVFGSCFLTAAGYILFMTYQNHPQPRYYTVVALFAFMMLVMGVEALVRGGVWGNRTSVVSHPRASKKARRWGTEVWVAGANEMPEEHASGAETRVDFEQVLPGINPRPTAPTRPTDSLEFTASARPAAWLRYSKAWGRIPGTALLGAALVAVVLNIAWTWEYAAHPEYTLVDAARQLTRYIDQHPNGNRMLVSISGDEISLMTHLPTLCDDFGMEDLPGKLAAYEPGWWATWNDIDPGTLEDLHVHHSLEQVASFHALDDPERNVLVLFKLHPLPGGVAREPQEQNLQVPLPGDRIEIPVE